LAGETVVAGCVQVRIQGPVVHGIVPSHVRLRR
jgi:hypothetical protein